MAVTTETFGTLRDGREARLFTISTAAGSSVTLTDFGATLVKLLFPDSLGRLGDVALGFDQLSMYEQDIGNFGAVCGRFANRLSRASLPLDRRVYPLVRNDGPNTLHGGAIGFHHRLWDAEVLGEDAVRFSRFSPDGEEGFPGDLAVSVTYRLTDEGVLSLDYEAADRAAGHSKYSIRKLFRFSMNTIISFSDLPLRLGVYAGGLSGLLGLILLIYSVAVKFRKGAPDGYTTIIVLICFMFAVLFLLVGIIGQYIGVLFQEIKGRPLYLVEETHLMSFSILSVLM